MSFNFLLLSFFSTTFSCLFFASTFQHYPQSNSLTLKSPCISRLSLKIHDTAKARTLSPSEIGIYFIKSFIKCERAKKLKIFFLFSSLLYFKLNIMNQKKKLFFCLKFMEFFIRKEKNIFVYFSSLNIEIQ